MGFCSCSLQTSTITAVVFGFVQSIVGIVAGSVFSMLFDPSNVYIPSNYESSTDANNNKWEMYRINAAKKEAVGFSTCKSIAEAHVAFHVVWLLSSVILIIGITKEHVWLHRQWTIVTSCILVSDAILFTVACTQFKFFDRQVYLLAFLLLVLSQLCLIGLIIDICLAMYVNQRATEILRGPTPNAQIVIAGGQSIQLMVLPSNGHPGQQFIIQPVNPSQPSPSQGQVTYGPPGVYPNQFPLLPDYHDSFDDPIFVKPSPW